MFQNGWNDFETVIFLNTFYLVSSKAEFSYKTYVKYQVDLHKKHLSF